ncbi:hypothetical protein [Polynucleobacter sp. MWH-HuK1]|uniref:hypothetical protein n=1 Tax=Polynucleobacter sp. MWH-HuK1 TaxID=1743158 RepID=UPI001C0E271E|nr:hypothetical protein [Polynucleobacter sp. MWH-HuK1]MBU3565343.1 hypothetical protein [Polynucleobacter sp. MWH-HuK1]
MKKYEILSIEASVLAHYWVITYILTDGEIQKVVMEALDPNQAFIKFRNEMIIKSKLNTKKIIKSKYNQFKVRKEDN